MSKIECNFISYSLRRAVDITVILPTVSFPDVMLKQDVHHVYEEKFSVLYLLHGKGNNHKQWTGYSNVELFAEERMIAVVMMSAENKFYLNGGTDNDFERLMNEELPEFITNTFPVSKEAKDTYIAGLSMGGFGALYHGMKYGGRYQAIGSFSGALEHDGVSIEQVTRASFEEGKRLPNLYLACGTRDFLYQDNIKYRDFLREKGIAHTWYESEKYGHEWRFWNICIENFLDWIDRSDFYKDKRRKV